LLIGGAGLSKIMWGHELAPVDNRYARRSRDEIVARIQRKSSVSPGVGRGPKSSIRIRS
jgi:hypothetical protein